MVVVAEVTVKGASTGPGAGSALFLILLLYLQSALGEHCIIPSPHAFFINDLGEMNDRICHRCYQAPPTQQLTVKLHKIRLLDLSSIMIYVDGEQRPINQDCGCPDVAGHNSTESVDGEQVCQECESIPSGALFEMYLRLDAKTEIPNGDTACQKIADFNISISIPVPVEKPESEASTCDNGLMVSLPVGVDTCLVNSTAMPLETHCLIPTCSDGIITTDQLIEKVEHVFQPLAPSESCVWQLNTATHKHLTLRFSRGIRPHLVVYEDSLLNPKWDIEWCPAYSDVFRQDTEADTLFVVYHNPSKLAKQGSLSITTQPDLCLLPPLIEDGSVDFKREDGSTVAHYRCSPGHTLLGPPSLTCTEGIWLDPPSCVLDKDKLMSDAPMGSVEGSESVNMTVLSPEVGINNTTDDVSDDGKMPLPVDDGPDAEVEEILEEKAQDNNEETREEDMILKEVWENNESLPNGTVDWPLETFEDDGNSTAKNSTYYEDERNVFKDLLEKLDLKEDTAIYVIAGGSGLVLLLVILLVVMASVCRKSYPGRLALGRRFDTFQNPIYEKAVVRVPMQPEGQQESQTPHTEEEEEEEEERKKSDAEEMSDCTVLE